LDNTNGIKN